MASNNRKRCANCGAQNAANASNCVICGARLGRQRVSRRANSGNQRVESFNTETYVGEDDLLVRSAFSTPLGVLTALVALVVIGGGLLLLASQLIEDDNSGLSSTESRGGQVQVATQTPSPQTPSATAFPTNTRPAPRTFPSVTPLPATPTPTPTEGPCVRTAQSGDTLYGLAQQCGHRNFAIVDVILTENPSLTCSTCLQEGQTINIPYPTPTVDPNATLVPEDSGNTSSLGTPQNLVAQDNSPSDFDGTPEAVRTLFVEPTLRPGLQWHTVGDDENMIIIASLYSADAKVLSDINPEIDFGQCDFSERFGGPLCTVLLFPGQRIRVPAPTPTPTLSATPSGSETPTPTYTPTFNVPAAFSPQDDTLFDANSLVTLRWSSSGSLGVNEAYVVEVQNLDTEEAFREITTELFFVLPETWQPESDDVQSFEWTVGIATLDGNTILTVRETTLPRTFQWQGR